MSAPIERTCLDCDEDIPNTDTAFYVPTSLDEQFWLRKPSTEGPLCRACKTKRDNYEPPDADGEDMFRDYAAERRDAAEAARRLK